MTDRELLELAAKAHGGVKTQAGMFYVDSHQQGWLRAWDPLRDDGESLRLAVKLGLLFKPEFASFLARERFAGQEQDDCFATRRAIVRAAAEIGRTMK